jgi:hypothetical protein
MIFRSSVNRSSLHDDMDFKYVNGDLATSPERATRSSIKHRVIRPIRRGTRRATWPRGDSRLRLSLRRYSKSGRPSCTSLTKVAQWYLDTRRGSKETRGLLYSVPSLPPSYSADSVVRALDAAIGALQPEPKSPVVWYSPDDLEALFHHSLTPRSPPAASESIPTFAEPLIDLASFPDSTQEHPPQVVPVLKGSLADIPDLPDLPVVKSSSTSVDDLLFADTFGPATLWAPLIPASPGGEFVPGPDHLSLAPNCRYPGFQTERRRTEPQIRRKPAIRDLKSRAATLPELRDLPTQLQVGVPVPEPIMRRKLAGQDSLKIRIPSIIQEEDIPQSLQHGGKKTGLSPGPDAEIDCLIGAVDVVKESFKPQLDPLEADLGHFSFDFLSSSTSSDSLSSDLASTSQTFTTPPTVSSRSSSKMESLSHVKKNPPNLSEMDDRSRHPYINRPLRPLPLAPEPMLPRRNGTSANLALSNATLKALLAAEDAANSSTAAKQSAKGSIFAQARLSKRSAAVVRDFSEFTHRTFFQPQQQQQPQPHDIRSQSDSALVAQQVPLYRCRADVVVASSPMQPRAHSGGSLAMRKAKGRGIVFTNPAEWKVHSDVAGHH